MRFEVRVEHVPWKPVTRADLGPAPSVTRVSVGPGNAHVRVAVQASQDRQGHTRPACRRAADGRAVRHAWGRTSHWCRLSPPEKAAQAAAWASA